jgi:hypothetical protein
MNINVKAVVTVLNNWFCLRRIPRPNVRSAPART